VRSNSAQRPRSGLDTRRRILAIAREMFARQGYAETSMPRSLHELGTTQSRHLLPFRLQTNILDALLVGLSLPYSELAERAESGLATPNELLGKLIDFVADSQMLIPLVSSDPSYGRCFRDRLPHEPGEMSRRSLPHSPPPSRTGPAIFGQLLASLSSGGYPGSLRIRRRP